MYSPQESESSQPRMDPYTAPGAYSQPEATPYPHPMPGTYPYPNPPQGGYPPAPGAGSYTYLPQGGYIPPQGGYIPQGQKVQNGRATRAMIYGFISIFLGLITLLQQVGAAGVITGTFAIFYGFTSLKIAKQLPGNTGRGQAIAGIVLGFVAWFLVIASLIIRAKVQ